VLRGHLDADGRPALAARSSSCRRGRCDGVRLRRALPPPRHLTHHRSLRPAPLQHRAVEHTAARSGAAPAGAVQHEQQQQQWEKRRGTESAVHGVRKACVCLSLAKDDCNGGSAALVRGRGMRRGGGGKGGCRHEEEDEAKPHVPAAPRHDGFLRLRHRAFTPVRPTHAAEQAELLEKKKSIEAK
ncbi:uncharacterized protein Tco025E_10053, partial [Trypanosoma conorhini]